MRIGLRRAAAAFILAGSVLALSGGVALAKEPRRQALPQAGGPIDEQLAAGREVYRLWCSACHAYSGEGLTDAWRSTWPPEDQNCWQSKCHSENHPSDGFLLPRFVPAVVGQGVLSHFGSAAGLYAFIAANMPYQEPGALPAEKYYQALAVLLKMNGFALGPQALGSDNVAAIDLRLAPEEPPPQPTAAETPIRPEMPPPAHTPGASAGASNSSLLAGILGSLLGAAILAVVLAAGKARL